MAVVAGGLFCNPLGTSLVVFNAWSWKERVFLWQRDTGEDKVLVPCPRTCVNTNKVLVNDRKKGISIIGRREDGVSESHEWVSWPQEHMRDWVTELLTESQSREQVNKSCGDQASKQLTYNITHTLILPDLLGNYRLIPFLLIHPMIHLLVHKPKLSKQIINKRRQLEMSGNKYTSQNHEGATQQLFPQS